MKIKNIGRVQVLIKERERMYNIIEKFENEEITFVDERCNKIETPNECIAQMIADVYRGIVEMIEKEIEEL